MSKKLTYEELEQRVRELEASPTLREQSRIDELIESIQAGVVVHGRDGTVIKSNTTAQIMLGLTQEQMLGKELIDPAWTFLREDGSPLPVEEYPVSRVLATKKPVHNLVAGIQRSDKAEPIWVLDTAIPEFDENGHLSQIVTTFMDISPLKKSEEQYRNLFENMMHEVHLWKLVRDEQGAIKTWRLVEVNPAALKAWGKTRSEIIGKTTNEIFSYDATEQFMPIVKKIFSERIPYTWDAYFPPTGQFYHMTSVSFGEYFMSTGTDISDRKQTEMALQKSENLLSQAEEIANIGSWEWDVENDIAYWSDGLFKIFKRSPKEGAPKWAQQSGFYTKESHEKLSRAVERCVQNGIPYEVEVQAICSDGEIRTCISRGRAEKNNEGKIFRLLGIFDDITERIKTEQALKRSESLLRNVIDSSTDYIFVKDKNLKTLLCNQKFAQAVNKKPSDLIGKTDIENGWNAELVKSDPDKGIIGYEKYDLEALSGKIVQNTDTAIISGKTLFLDTVKIPLKDENNEIFGVLGISRDITDRKEIERQLQAAATRDALTSLYNRGEIMRKLESELTRANRYARPLSLLLVDLDYFKSVNDQYGHLAGDSVLVAFAQTVLNAIREHDYAGRYGGEEFLVVLPETSLGEAEACAERIRKDVETLEISFGKHMIKVTSSIGIAHYDVGIASVDHLIENADRALYQAKSDGRNCMRVFDSSLA